MSSYPPYAGPAGTAATASSTHRADVRRPYVPATWRATPAIASAPVTAAAAPTAVAPSAESVPASTATALLDGETPPDAILLPSIDAFLLGDAVSDPDASGAVSGTAAGDIDVAGAPDESALRGEDWAMDDAAADVQALASGLVGPDAVRDASLLLPPLPMWSDDDIMDIMPIARPAADDAARRSSDDAAQRLFGAAPSAASPSSQPDFGGAASDMGQGSEAAAEALETLARRIREGELPIPGYAPGMGDAAALTAALASILGLRR